MVLKKYLKLIESWHKMAEKQSDYFLKFILEYISFNAWVKQQNSQKDLFTKERNMINAIKLNKSIIKCYLKIVDKDLIKDLIEILDNHPIENVKYPDDSNWNGKIINTQDFAGIIEFIYRVRNNLFHGDKQMNFERDEKLVKYGYKLLQPLMNMAIRLGDSSIFVLNAIVPNNNSQNITCPFCNKKFQDKTGFWHHFTAKHIILK